MSRRVTVTTGFAGLMVVLTLVGVGVGYAIGSVVGATDTAELPTAVTSTSTAFVAGLPPTTATTTKVAGQLQGPQCLELSQINGRMSDVPPAFFAIPSPDDEAMIADLRRLNSKPTEPHVYTDLDALGRSFAISPGAGVIIAPFRTAGLVERSVVLTRWVGTTVIYYQNSDSAVGAKPTTYPSVLLMLGPRNVPESAVGLERLITNLLADGSRASGCAPV